VVIAFDADATKNKVVKRQLNRLAETILKLGYRVRIARWDISLGKGIDDLLVGCHSPSIEPFHPKVNLDHLKASPKHEGKKRVRRRMITNTSQVITKPWEPCISEIREVMASRVAHFIDDSQNEGFLLKVAQGIGKTTTSLQVVNEMFNDNLLRPVYATIRHELIDQSIPKGWLHIRPRKPRDHQWCEVSPLDGLIHIESNISGIGYNYQGLEILCHHFKKADQLGQRRWNVPKNVCGSTCEIGTSLVGTQGCPYFLQYQQPLPLATVHETLFIPKFCDDIFANPTLTSNPAFKQVLIIDEPNPAKFIEKVNITVSDLRHARDGAWDDGLKNLLELLRETAEEVAKHEEKKRLMGQKAMDAIIKQAGGVRKFSQMLKKAKAESPRTHETVVVAIDGFLGDTNKSWKS
jgi:hypothetical protein